MNNFSNRDLRKLLIVLVVYLTSLFAANTLGLKIMPFLFRSHLSVGFISFPIVMITIDVVSEVYGKKIAKMFVLAGVVSIALFILYSIVSLALPWDQAGLWARDGYNLMFGISARISVASLVAFAIGEYQDVIAFFFFRKKIGAKKFWLRANLANLWSEFFDTVIFMVIAFYGVYDNHTLLIIILTWWLYKVAMGVCYTPLSYVAIYILRGGKKNLEIQNENSINQNQNI